MNKAVSVLFMLLIKASLAISQVVPEFASYDFNKIPPSPEVAAIGKYAVHNISSANGKQQISLPLFSIKCGNTSIPISLDYSAGGIKVEEIASSVGLGWSLSAGGMISRTSVGAPDDTPDNGYIDNETNDAQTIFQAWTAWLNPSIFEPDPFVNLRKSIGRGELDVEPDMYFFSLPGKSGRFVINSEDKKVYPIPFDHINITYERSPATSLFDRWVVTGDDGTRYILGKRTTSEPTSVYETTTSVQTGFRSGSQTAYTTWFLREMISPDNTDTIRFNYISYNTGYCNQLSLSQRLSYANDYVCIPLEENNSTRMEIESYIIQSITGRFGEVAFSYEGNRTDLFGGKILKEVTVKDAANNLVKRFQLAQSYFKSDAMPNTWNAPCVLNYQGSQSWRLKFDGLKELGKAGEVLEHTFEYDYNEASGRVLPSRTSFAQDDWGYYNGVSNFTLVPRYPIYARWDQNSSVLDGAIRTPSESHTKIGSLTKINYPTGGSTVYEYEQHEAYTNNFVHEVALPNENVPYVEYARIESDDISGTELISPPFTVSNLSYRNQFAYFELVFVHPYYGDCDYDTRGDRNCRVLVDVLNGDNQVLFTVPVGNTIRLLNDGVYKLKMRLYDKNEYTMGVVAYIKGPQIQSQIYNKKIGGLRLKRITDFDGIKSTPVLTKEYKYRQIDSTVSSGVINYHPSYHSFLTYTSDPEVGTSLCHAKIFQRTAVSNLPLTSFAGSPVCYARVEAYEVGSVEKIKSVSFFSTEGDDWGNYAYYPNPPGVNLEHRRGLLLKQEMYKSVGSGYSIVSEKINNYRPLCLSDNATACPNVKYHYGLRLMGANFGYIIGETHPTSSMNLYKIVSDWTVPTETIDRTYVSATEYIEKKQTYSFDKPAHGKLTSATERTSDGNDQITEIIYSSDYAEVAPGNSHASAISTIRSKKAILPVEKLVIKKDANNNQFVTGGSILMYKANNLQLHELYTLALDKPVPLSQFTKSNINGAGNFGMDTRYRRMGVYETYDQFGNVVNTNKENDISYAYLYGYRGLYPVCQVSKATADQIAYTSLESDDWGGWTMNPGSVVADYYNALTGRRTISGGVQKNVPAGNYVVSFWSLANAWVNSQPLTVIRTVGEWKYFETTVQNVTYINVAGDRIDEIRLYPVGAKMTTYTYDPLIGITSQCDVNNRITYYEYDGLNRLLRVRDEQKSILKQYDYKYQTVSHGNPIWQTTGATRCKPCPGNAAYVTNMLQNEERDKNPNSATYNLTRWVDTGNPGTCTITADWQNTGNVQCRTDGNGYRTGTQRVEKRDLNPCSPTYNQLQYQDISNTSACPPNAPNWQSTGATRCKPCPANSAFTTNMQQIEERDNTPGSATFNQTRWTDTGNPGSCTAAAAWTNTATAIRCKQVGGNNTGEQEQEQRDLNPCSATYNQLRWQVIGTSTTCPTPLYAKIVIENEYGGTTRYGNVVVRFYEDAAGTIPRSVSNLTVKWGLNEYLYNGNVYNYYSYSTSGISGTSYVLSYNAITYEDGYDPFYYYYSNNYYYILLSDPAYVITY